MTIKADSLSLRDLSYLLTVGKTLHFAKAAEACHVSQPALSIQVKKLEEQLGVLVFERTNRRVAVTPAGLPILKQAQLILDEVNRLTEMGRGEGKPLSGSLRLGAIATLGPYLIPHFLTALRRRYPALELFIKEGLTDDLLADLQAGELDAVLAADTFTRGGLVKRSLFEEPFLLGVPKGHPLEKQSKVSAHDLASDQMVLLADGHCLTDQTLAFCRRGKGVSRGTFQATSLETLRALVASGLGYSLFPKLAVPKKSPLDALLTYRALTPSVGRKILLVYRETFGRPEDLQALEKCIREAIL